MTDLTTLPVIPLREAVLFPEVTSPIAAGRPGTLRAIDIPEWVGEQLLARAPRSSREQQ